MARGTVDVWFFVMAIARFPRELGRSRYFGECSGVMLVRRFRLAEIFKSAEDQSVLQDQFR